MIKRKIFEVYDKLDDYRKEKCFDKNKLEVKKRVSVNKIWYIYKFICVNIYGSLETCENYWTHNRLLRNVH